MTERRGRFFGKAMRPRASDLRMRNSVIGAGFWCFLFMLGSALGAPIILSAQEPRPARRPVVVALVDTLRGTTGIVVSRRGSGTPDMILLRASTADGEALAAAVFALVVSRQVTGKAISSPLDFHVPRQVPVGWRTTELPRADRVVRSRLTAAPHRSVPGVGRVRAIGLYLLDGPATGVRVESNK